jgi:hypothetical protein
MKPSPQIPLVNFKFLSPFGETLSFSSESNVVILARVSPLCLMVRPTAIFFAVRSVCILPVKSKTFFISGDHIPFKDAEIFPFLTNNNAAPSVTGEAGVLRISASRQHRSPCSVQNGSFLSVRILIEETSASFCSTMNQVVSHYRFTVPTFTLANPRISPRLSWDSLRLFYGGKFSKFLSRYTLAAWSFLTKTDFSHKTSFFRWLVSASMQPNTALGRAHLYIFTR